MIILLVPGLLLLWFLWKRFYTDRLFDRLRIMIRFSDPFVFAGEELYLTETIENRKKLPIPFMQIGFRIPIGVSFVDAENTRISDYTYKRDLFAILGMEKIIRRYRMHAEKRGYYRISQLAGEAPSLLHLARVLMEAECDMELYVYAARTRISDLMVQVETINGEIETTRRLYEDPFAFASIREYTLSDPMKSINWKASARTGRLMVNTYSSVTSEEIDLYLDLEDSGILKEDNLIEESISIAATFTSEMLRKNRSVSLYLNVQDEADGAYRIDGQEHGIYFRQGLRPEEHQRIEEYLTRDFSKIGIIPFEAMLSAVFAQNADRNPIKSGMEPDRKVRVLITKNVREAWLQENAGMLKGCILVVPCRKAEDLPRIPEGLYVVPKETIYA